MKWVESAKPEKEWMKDVYDVTYERFISFLSLLAGRCKRYFPRKLARPSIPTEIMMLLAKSRALSFKAKRKGDIGLRQEARRLRNVARFELKCFQHDQLSKRLKERNSPGEDSTIFWSKTKRHFRTVSSSLKGFILQNGETIKEPQMMANIAADYYETLFKEPSVVRLHPYVDAPAVQWDNEADKIPLATYPEVVCILRTRKKNNPQIFMVSLHICLIKFLEIIGICLYSCIMIHFPMAILFRNSKKSEWCYWPRKTPCVHRIRQDLYRYSTRS